MATVSLFIGEDTFINLRAVSAAIWDEDIDGDDPKGPADTFLKVYLTGDEIPIRLRDDEAESFLNALTTYHELKDYDDRR